MKTMKEHGWTSVLALAVALTVWSGCGRGGTSGKIETVTPAQAGSQLDQAFQAADASVKQNATFAADAMKKGEYEKAVTSLQAVQQSQSLTLDQGLAIHRSVISMERELINGIERGDPRAKQAYELLKRMRRN